MSSTNTPIIHDERIIQSAWGKDYGATVGRFGVTRIEPYQEDGQMAPVTWLRVWKGDTLLARLNTAHVAEIRYVPLIEANALSATNSDSNVVAPAAGDI